eukprot:TRINITY_DN33809_c0_g1_i1.p3 TRINITY_DN33809_c0_g1~~TRINITY_DN33809_c0_g1_i1.p3  ORF type:complete len:147 (-),score=0.14 TRINITY_DN33809_c0_g1_i1:618-1025(-)
MPQKNSPYGQLSQMRNDFCRLYYIDWGINQQGCKVQAGAKLNKKFKQVLRFIFDVKHLKKKRPNQIIFLYLLQISLENQLQMGLQQQNYIENNTCLQLQSIISSYLQIIFRNKFTQILTHKEFEIQNLNESWLIV